MKSKLLRNKTKFIFFYFIFVTTQFVHAGPGNFIWNGSTDSKWSVASNWTPNGIPLASDSITIVAAANNLIIDDDKTINLFTVNSGTIDLNGFTLSVNGKCLFKGGVVHSGKLVISNTSSITFAGTTFETKITANCYSIYLNGSTFEDSVSITKNADSNDNSLGGNHFNNHVLLSNTSGGAIVLGDSFPDVFEKTLFVKNINEKGGIYLAHRASGNLFKKDVTFTGWYIFSNYYGTAEYSGNIILNCPNGQIYFGTSTGSCSLANSHSIQLGDSVFSSGKLSLRHFTKLGTEGPTELALTGSAVLEVDGSSFQTPFIITTPGATLKNTRFLSEVSLTKNGSSTSTSPGGCYFAATTSITNNNSSGIFTLGSILPDTFAVATTILNTHGTLNINNARFEGEVTLKNTESIGGNDRFYVAATGNCFFNSALTIDNIGTGICFGNSTGSTILSASSTLSFAAGFNGILTLRNFSKLGTNSQTINFPYATTTLTLGPNSLFNGNFNYTGRSIALNGTTFNGAVSIIKYGTNPDTCQGGNVFNSSVIIKDSTSVANQFIWGYTLADDFNGDVTFSQKGTGVAILPAYTKNSTFAGNIYLEGTSAIQFGVNGGKVILDGNTNSTINNATYYTPTIKKLQVNKSSGYVTLNSSILISDSLILSSGRLNTDSTNLISLSNNSKLSGGSDGSYINGPVKKIGSNAFVFPLGSPTLAHPYHPLEITAPTTSTDAYTSQYFSQGQTIGSAIDTSIDNLNACQYWKLIRNAGTSTVKVKLNWNNDSCESISPSNYRVTGWNGSMWKDLGNGNTSGDSIVGSVQSLAYLNTISILTVAFHKCSAFRKTISHLNAKCNKSYDGEINVVAKGGTAGYSYAWTDEVSTSSNARGLSAGTYSFTATDFRGCHLTDSIVINEPSSISLAVVLDIPDCGSSTGSIEITAGGGVGGFEYYWPTTTDTTNSERRLSSGEYSVLVTDSNGCTNYKEIKLPSYGGPEMSILSQTNASCFGSNDGAIAIEASGGNDPYHYKWDRYLGDTLSSLSLLPAGKYAVQITSSIGCMSLDTIEIIQPDTFNVVLQSSGTACGSSTGQLVAIPQGGAQPLTYFWLSTSVNDSVLTGLSPGLDTLVVTDANGCVIQKTGEIMSTSGINLTAEVLSPILCYPDSAGSARAIVSGGTSPYEFKWSDGSSNDTAINLSPISYSVTVIDANGCRAKANVSLNAPQSLNLEIETTQPSADSSSNGSIASVVTGGTQPYTYFWSNSQTTPKISNLSVGDYGLTVTDANGCQQSLGFPVHLSSYNCWLCNDPTLSDCAPFNFVGITGAFKDIKSDFGALGDGETDDQCAFEKAAAYFRTLAPSTPKVLSIPYGLYRVGKQIHLTNWYLQGQSVMCFDHIANLTIQGILDVDGRRPIIKIKNCMKFGVFDYPSNSDNRLLTDPVETRYVSCTLTAGDPTVIIASANSSTSFMAAGFAVTCGTNLIVAANTSITSIINSTQFVISPAPLVSGTYTLIITSNCPNPASHVDYSKLANIGDIFHFSESHDFTIKDLEIDGNIDSTIIGGGYSDGIQAEYDGIFINACYDSHLSNLYIHHFGHDGIYIIYENCDPSEWGEGIFNRHTCFIDHCNVRFNSRNGMSWGGGRGLYVSNSMFGYSGLNRVSMNPGAGVDIEYENSTVGNSGGIFQNTIFFYNLNYGLINAAQQQGTQRFNFDHHFFSCIFTGSGGPSETALYPNAPNMLIENSFIYGRVNNPYERKRILHTLNNTPADWQNILTIDPVCLRFNLCSFNEEYTDPITEEKRYFSVNNAEVIDLGGVLTPSHFCQTHAFMLDFSHAKNIRISNSVVNTNFTNLLIDLSAENHLSVYDYNYITNTIFRSGGLNACHDERDLYSLNQVIFGTGTSYLWHVDYRRNLCSGGPPLFCDYSISYLGSVLSYVTLSQTSIGVISLNIDPTLLGDVQSQITSIPPNQPQFYDPLTPKYVDPSIVNQVTDYFWAPCKSEPAWKPSNCSSIIRMAQSSSEKFATISDEITIVPNPAFNQVQFGNLKINSYLQIMDYIGRICYYQKCESETINLSTEFLNPGFYLIRCGSCLPKQLVKL